MVRSAKVLMLLCGALIAAPQIALAEKATKAKSVSSEDPNDKMAHERTFEETRKHMQAHSEWSKKTGKMSDN